ncbi:MAG: alpha-N-arabinofuranosidase [Ignavibacteriae bacterium]|nr:alpha-N-arabinofuranosidase [Ignavibacteriota bacterium]
MRISKLYISKIISILTVLFICTNPILSQNLNETKIIIDLDKLGCHIDPNIYGQFAEHLGSCIYGGIWVGENSKIPNTNGYRNDVLEALKKLEVPVLRWPGGCFADEYHWMDGIGPKENRPSMVNTNWGGVVEDNSFGTNEFLNLCEIIGAEPYISANVGSGTVEEFADWIQYTTSESGNPMSDLRKKNGREKPWKVKYWGIGNESWGCGGRMRPAYYADLARVFSTYAKNYAGNQIYKIASGPNVDDTLWTDDVMQIAGKVINGIGMHYYTNNSKTAADFDESGWFSVIQKTLRMDELIQMHTKVMDKYDPAKNVALIIDEWGTWHNVEPGTNSSFLYQQNTLRDAIVAASNLNIFHKYTDRVKMTNIAQMVNVLQAMILTDNEKMVLTPTYHVFEMYKVHKGAINLPIELHSSQYSIGGESISSVNATASINSNGVVHISLCNVNPNHNENVKINLEKFINGKVTGRILTSDEMNALNSFDNQNNVEPTEFSDFEISKNNLTVNLPSKSVVVLKLDGELNSSIGNAIDVKNPKPKLNYNYYKKALLNLPNFDELKLVSEGLIDQIKIPENSDGSDFAVKYSGLIKIPQDGFYNFYANSDDGTKLYIDGKLLISNDGRHAPIEVQGFASLKKGFHKIELEFFQAGGGLELNASIEGPGMKKQIIPAEMFFHETK